MSFSSNNNFILTPFDYNGSDCSINYVKQRRTHNNLNCQNGYYVLSYNDSHLYTQYNIKIIADFSTIIN